MRAEQAALKLLLDYDFYSVLDVGSGDGRAERLFKMCGKDVTSIDINPNTYATYAGVDFNEVDLKGNKWDCVWCSHVLEHQLNVQYFLTKILQHVKNVVCITVPPYKPNIVGGHYTLWNMGLLIYNMVMAGFDCSELIGLKQGYNISIITPVKTYQDPGMKYDKGDLENLSPYFPNTLNEDLGGVTQNFNGDIEQINWYEEGVVYC